MSNWILGAVIVLVVAVGGLVAFNVVVSDTSSDGGDIQVQTATPR